MENIYKFEKKPNEIEDEITKIAKMCLSNPFTIIGSQTGIERTNFMVQILEEIVKIKKGKVLIHSLERSESYFRKEHPIWSDDIIVDDDICFETEEQWFIHKGSGITNLVAIAIDELLLVNSFESILALSEKFKLPIISTTVLSRTASDHQNGGRPWFSDLPHKIPQECLDFVLLLWREHLTERVMGGAHLLPIGNMAELEILTNKGACHCLLHGNINRYNRYSFYDCADRYNHSISSKKFMYDAFTYTNAFSYLTNYMFMLIEHSVAQQDISPECGEQLKKMVLGFKDEWRKNGLEIENREQM